MKSDGIPCVHGWSTLVTVHVYDDKRLRTNINKKCYQYGGYPTQPKSTCVGCGGGEGGRSNNSADENTVVLQTKKGSSSTWYELVNGAQLA